MSDIIIINKVNNRQTKSSSAFKTWRTQDQSHSSCHLPLWLRVESDSSVHTLTRFPRRCFFFILNIHRRDFVFDVEVLEKRKSSVMRSCYRSPSYNRQESSLEYGMIACIEGSCEATSRLTIMTEGLQKSESMFEKFVWYQSLRPTLMIPFTLKTVMLCVSLLTILSPP